MNRSLTGQGIYEKVDNRFYKCQGIENSRLYIRGGPTDGAPAGTCRFIDAAMNGRSGMENIVTQ